MRCDPRALRGRKVREYSRLIRLRVPCGSSEGSRDQRVQGQGRVQGGRHLCGRSMHKHERRLLLPLQSGIHTEPGSQILHW